MVGVVVLHVDREDTLVGLVKHLLTLCLDLAIVVVGILIHRLHLFRYVRQRTTSQIALVIVFVFQFTLLSRGFQHRGFHQITRSVVLAVDDVGGRVLAVLVEMLHLGLKHGVLGDDLLHIAFQSLTHHILVVGCGVEVEHVDGARLVLVQDIRDLHIALVHHQVQRAISLGIKIAEVALQFQQEITVVTVVEGEGAIGSAGDEHRRQQPRLLVCRHHEVRPDAVEIPTEIVVARIGILGGVLFQTDALQSRYKHGVGPFQGHTHHVDTPLVEIALVENIITRCVLSVHSE